MMDRWLEKFFDGCDRVAEWIERIIRKIFN
jgi:hypothetical protein